MDRKLQVSEQQVYIVYYTSGEKLPRREQGNTRQLTKQPGPPLWKTWGKDLKLQEYKHKSQNAIHNKRAGKKNLLTSVQKQESKRKR